MATFAIMNHSNEKVGELEASDQVFGVEVKPHLFWALVRNQLASRRAGTAKAKTRSEVRGGGRKPFRQKGTGRARQGTIRAPHMVGGGVAHGPQPRDYSYKVPKKVRRQALCSALSLRAQESKITVLNDLELAEAKTRGLKGILDTLKLPNALIIDTSDNKNLILSCRNLTKYQVLPPQGLNVYDILRFDHLVLTRDAVDAVLERLESKQKDSAK